MALVAGFEPMPGYRLLERLGRGGFGEVWKAEAPGGFLVALKFVQIDADAGPAELRALEVVRTIRHPQLLAMCGNWHVHGYLVIAMELADRTLLDRFRESVGQGFPGIPMPEILEYFHDAARGLDYLNEPRHPMDGKGPQGIQHRDVKPQNLLLLGGSVKIADFGLAKVLEKSQASHTGSMTVAYAAPEFFNKVMANQSDQYSLAVTYCHLRGGRLPFTGNINELIAGHLYQKPDLSMIPAAERSIIAKALSKNPEDRWSRCRSFVDAIRETQSGPGGRVVAAVPQAGAKPVPAPASNYDLEDDDSWEARASSLSTKEASQFRSTQPPTTKFSGASEKKTLGSALPGSAQGTRHPTGASFPKPKPPADPDVDDTRIEVSSGGGRVWGWVAMGLVCIVGMIAFFGLLNGKFPEIGSRPAQVTINAPEIGKADASRTLPKLEEPKRKDVEKPTSSIMPNNALKLEEPKRKASEEPSRKMPNVVFGVGSRAGQEWINDLGMTLCWCPPGKFLMGSPASEPERVADENPVDVTLTRGYWLGKYEVTQGEWEKVMGSNPSWFRNGGGGADKVVEDTGRFPVESVSHTEAVRFCVKLTERERKAGRLGADEEYRLPTEAQWEYACRAGTTSATAFGNTLSSTQANFDGRLPYNGADPGPYLERTQRVGAYQPNAWGLYDMHGNVREWCLDWYGGHLTGGVDPELRSAGSLRVGRGGRWDFYGRSCRSALRGRNFPGDRRFNLGFRVALVPSQGKS